MSEWSKGTGQARSARLVRTGSVASVRAREGPKLAAIVLAAGEGTRMRSTRPKPLHKLCGRPMVLWVLDALAGLELSRVVVVVGHGATGLTKALAEASRSSLEIVEQPIQRGTGDAASVALTAFNDDEGELDDLIVLPGDTPLLRPATLVTLVKAHRAAAAAATLLTARLPDATGYGRVVRAKNGSIAAIVEESDANDEERAIDEVGTSIYAFRRSVLAPALRRLSPDNAQGEYYLTDVVAVLHDAGYPVGSVVAEDPMEAAGVNDRAQLAAAEAVLRSRLNERWMRLGVTMLDPSHTYLDSTVELAEDVTIFPGTVLQGHTRVAAGAELGPNTHLIDCTVGARAQVRATTAEQVTIGEYSRVGPWLWLMPGTVVAPGSEIRPALEPGNPEGDVNSGTGLET
ncbi:MAG TPA: NTP transferase domain-containing protein [Acidimicrobiales bacterium]|nr:NTP transferase domain-containing protein [Acidimicrobiales bacterium]